MSSNTIQGVSEIVSTSAANCSVTRLEVRSHAKIDAPATMKRTTAVVSMVSKLTRRKRRQVSVR